MIHSNLERSFNKVYRAIKDGEIRHPEVSKLLEHLMVYEHFNDIYESELEMALIETTHKLELFEQIFPGAYFIVTSDKIELHNVDIRKHAIKH